ncbi:VWA domain-containing protein [Photobacterium damselae]|uniref:VWA domain-containing protein n=1 Tax=Photobacterium damselae TaxID=38293 RepID=UPI002542F638
MIPILGMLSEVATSAFTRFVLVKLATKATKYFIDDNFRSKVTPIEGSVVYSDLFTGVEHSGIYIGDGKISNIVVTGTFESEVKLDSASTFVDSSKLHSKIYVSCNSNGAVGHQMVADEAESRIGDKAFYGLIIQNCHEFSRKCVEKAPENLNLGLWDKVTSSFEIEDTWEFTIGALKRSAKKHMRATKWRLWEQGQGNSISESELKQIYHQLDNTPLDSQTLDAIIHSQFELERYSKEIEDENLPASALKNIDQYKTQLAKLKYAGEKATKLSKGLGYSFTYNELKDIKDIDFSSLAQELASNQAITDIVTTLGRAYISEKTNHKQVKRINTNEVYGTHKSADISRVLPSDLALLENEDLEYLFYAKLLESNLSTYKLLGHHIDFEKENDTEEDKGPIVTCLDTSGSMSGIPILKARALLLAIHSIITKEKRELYVLLFGSRGQVKELYLSETSSSGLLPFICKEFSGGTDFETPLKRAINIIEHKEKFNKADILMITDGECNVSDNFQRMLVAKKSQLDFSVQTVICTGSFANTHQVTDGFSDRIVGI